MGRNATLVATAIYFVVATFAHLVFSLWLVAERTTTWQGHEISYTYRDFMTYLLPVLVVACVAWLTVSAVRHGTRHRILVVGVYWVVWLACVAAVDRWLTYSVAEYFHYPQYALLTTLLAKALDPDRRRWPVTRLLLITTLLGALDELAQYMWITISYSNYYDFNDVLVNLLAGVLGVMLYYGFRAPPAKEQHSTAHTPSYRGDAALVLSVLVVCGGALSTQRLAVNPPGPVPPGGILANPNGTPTLYLQRDTHFFGGWQPGIRHGKYHVLQPGWALIQVGLVLLLWSLWPLLARGQNSRARPAHIRPPSKRS